MLADDRAAEGLVLVRAEHHRRHRVLVGVRRVDRREPCHVVAPACGVGLQRRVGRLRERRPRLGDGALSARPEPDREHEVERRAGHGLPDLGHLGDVTVRRAIEMLHESTARPQIRDAIVDADEAAALLAEARRTGDRHDHVALRGNQGVAADVGRVVKAAVVHGGIDVHVHFERRPGRLDARVDHDRLVRRIGERLAHDAVAARTAGVGLPECQHVARDHVHAMVGVRALALEEAGAVGHEQIEQTKVGLVDCRVVGLGEHAVAKREPDFRDRRDRRADSLLLPFVHVARCPGPPLAIEAGGVMGGCGEAPPPARTSARAGAKHRRSIGRSSGRSASARLYSAKRPYRFEQLKA